MEEEGIGLLPSSYEFQEKLFSKLTLGCVQVMDVGAHMNNVYHSHPPTCTTPTAGP